MSVGQERMDELNPEKTVFDEISEGLDEIELGTTSVLSRAYLSWFGFKGGSQQSKVRSSFYYQYKHLMLMSFVFIFSLVHAVPKRAANREKMRTILPIPLFYFTQSPHPVLLCNSTFALGGMAD